MDMQLVLSEALGMIGGGIAVLATLPALAKVLKDRSGRAQTWLPGWIARALGGGERKSRQLMALGNTALAVSLVLAGGPMVLTACALAAAVLNAWIAIVLRPEKGGAHKPTT